ncbi:MAG TPA: DUF262 domain-containing protein [Prolixibacteraceae bacterium]|nr:DUF262 domain-containing protein [Prolixibacteraceae bacterium]
MNTREYTFQSLFGSTFEFEDNSITLSKIEIPIIQRDYAQGRKNDEVKRIRERFLDALFQSIVGNKHITLDFVYGDVSKDGVLTPLDGQQRLTTLFLLHWYIAKKENGGVKNYEFLNSFSYATRFSSRDFCQELVKYSPDFSDEKLSVAIKDQAWYPYEWKNDPTIQSMMVMIDAIHNKFDNHFGLWESLVTNKIISFYFLPLTEMGLTDDLYIKMNSRGKPLTPFEHFKAEFEEIIKHISEKLSKEINHKFDIDWTDMLFPFRGDNNIIDDEFMRYFHFISDIITYKSGLELERDEFKVARLLYSNENDKAKDNIMYLINSFDCWHKLDILNFFEDIFSKNAYQSGKVKIYQDDLNIFKECLDNYGEYSGRNRRFPLNKMLLLYSIITYLQNKESISEAQFHKRIRIIRNLIWNSTDEIRDDRMKTLLNESETIILSGEIPISESGELGYNVRQKEEERKKIEWLNDNAEKDDELYHLEDHSLLKGCVSIVDLNNSSNFKKFRLLFNNCNKDLINRILLTIGDYSQFISWRFQLGARYNESVWFDIFHPTKQRSGFEDTFKILNDLLSNLEESNINDEFIEKCIDAYLENKETPKEWSYYFIKYNPMRQGNFGMYYWKSLANRNYDVIMMNTEKSIGGKNWNIFLYTLNQLPEFSGKLSLGDYAYQGDKLKIKSTDYEIECQNDKYVVSQNELQTEYPIQQIEGIDKVDRIERGKQIIYELLEQINN